MALPRWRFAHHLQDHARQARNSRGVGRPTRFRLQPIAFGLAVCQSNGVQTGQHASCLPKGRPTTQHQRTAEIATQGAAAGAQGQSASGFETIPMLRKTFSVLEPIAAGAPHLREDVRVVVPSRHRFSKKPNLKHGRSEAASKVGARFRSKIQFRRFSDLAVCA